MVASEEANWPTPPRSMVVSATRASPATHHSGRVIPRTDARPASPNSVLAILEAPWFILAIWARWRPSLAARTLSQSLVPQKPWEGMELKVAMRGNSDT